MFARTKTIRARDISLHLSEAHTESCTNLPHCEQRHGLVSFANLFTCLLTLNHMLLCPLNRSSLLMLLHSRSIQLK